MPGQTPASGQARDAVCLMQRQEKTGGPRRVQRVLFVGSSHSIRGNVPALVEQIADSAPPGRVRIAARERTRMGTGMRGHWNDGVPHDAARGWIAAGGWDTVVVETFYRTSREELLGFGSGYKEEIQRSGARLLIYETPVAKAIESPPAYEAHHRTNLWLGVQLGSGVAPCVRAWMGVLGERPDQRALELLYADWIHTSARGAYFSACCLYAALIGESPAGLWAPPGLLAPDEARAVPALRMERICGDPFRVASGVRRGERQLRMWSWRDGPESGQVAACKLNCETSPTSLTGGGENT